MNNNHFCQSQIQEWSPNPENTKIIIKRLSFWSKFRNYWLTLHPSKWRGTFHCQSKWVSQGQRSQGRLPSKCKPCKHILYLTTGFKKFKQKDTKPQWVLACRVFHALWQCDMLDPVTLILFNYFSILSTSSIPLHKIDIQLIWILCKIEKFSRLMSKRNHSQCTLMFQMVDMSQIK